MYWLKFGLFYSVAALSNAYSTVNTFCCQANKNEIPLKLLVIVSLHNSSIHAVHWHHKSSFPAHVTEILEISPGFLQFLSDSFQ